MHLTWSEVGGMRPLWCPQPGNRVPCSCRAWRACEAVRESSGVPGACDGPVSYCSSCCSRRSGPGVVPWLSRGLSRGFPVVVPPVPPTSLSAAGWSYRYRYRDMKINKHLPERSFYLKAPPLPPTPPEAAKKKNMNIPIRPACGW